MSNGPVGFVDSGIGGIPYLLAARRIMPRDRFVYYADTANFPYGERPVDEVRRIALQAAELLIALEDPRAIVVACNTASVVALDALRARFAIPFVGVVPAIKPAAELAGRGRIGVLATQRTVEEPYLAGLISRFATGSEVHLVAAGGLVDLIERAFGSLGPAEIDAALEEPVGRLVAAGVDAVVLGCTHFIHVRDRIEHLLGPGVLVVDSVEGVVRQTARVAGEPVGERSAPREPTPLYVSGCGPPADSYRHLARTHELELREAHARHGAHR